MASIEITLDLTEPIDIQDLLGDIRFSSDRTVVVGRCVYVDTWFAALISGLQLLRSHDEAEVEILDEPSPLTLKRVRSQVRLSWNGSTVSFPSYSALETAVREASRSLKEQLLAQGVEIPSGELKRIANFYAAGA